VCFIRLYSDRLEFLSNEAAVGVMESGAQRVLDSGCGVLVRPYGCDQQIELGR